jgi:enoyl-CoA hydratase/carnithine racemase
MTIEVTLADGILTIRFNRAEKKNAITAAMYQAMADALGRAEADPEVRVVLFAGRGDAFTAGNDLKDFLADPPNSLDAPVYQFLRRLSTAEKILMAAVKGAAVGIGTTMLLHCDLVLAGSSAKFALPFVTLGLVPEAASSLLLPRLIGHQRTAELLLLAEPFDAAKAQSFGLVNKVVDDDEVEAAALAMARKIAQRPPAAVRLTKKLLKSAASTVAGRMEEEGQDLAAQLLSAEFQEAATAFFEKRPPDFSRFS